MNLAEKLKKKYTFEEYFELEKNSEVRHEFHDGELIPVENTTKIHNLIKRNLIRQIETEAFEDKGCQLFDENVMTQLQDKIRYVYPDIVVTCDVRDDDPYLVQYPVVVIEVLSPSTKKYDKTGKFFRYQRIPTLRQCVFVAQDEIEIHSFAKNEADVWVHELINSKEAFLNLPSINSKILVEDIYRRVVFPTE